ncbi:MAG: hypothetical protein ACI8PZ_003102 [Myxococcota bacterium]|jgi:hypothetical protein
MSNKLKIAAGVGTTGLIGCGGIAALGVVGLIAAVIAAPFLLAGPITDRLQQELDARLEAKVSFDDASLDLFGQFPALGVHVTGLTVTNSAAPFEGVVLAEVGELDVGVGWLGALTGSTLTISRLHLVEPAFHVVVTEEGLANYNLAPAGSAGEAVDAAETADAAEFGVNLNDVTITGLDLVYDDRAGGTFVEVSGLDHTLFGAVGSSAIDLSTATTIQGLTVRSGGATLLRDTVWDATVDVSMDMADGTLTFGENTVAVNALALAFAGTVRPVGDDVELDVTFSAPATEFASVLSLIPAMYSDSFADIDTAGTFTLSGSSKGTYKAVGDHLPAFDLALTVANGRFQMPDLPGKIQDIGLDLKVRHPEGATDLVAIDMPRFHMAVVNSPASPFDATLSLRNPMTDPFIDTTMKGELNLTGLKKAMPLDGMDIDGLLDLDFAIKGRMSDFETQNTKAISAKGFVRAKNVVYKSDDLPVDMFIDAGELSLAVDRQAVSGLKLRFGTSDLAVDGELIDLLPWSVGDGVLKGNVKLASSRLDLRPFQVEEGEEAATGEGDPAEEEMSVVVVPPNLDLAFAADLGRVRMDGMDLQSVKGRMAVKDQTVTLDKVTMGMIGGKTTMSGTYAARTRKEADVDMNIDMVSFGVGKTMAYFKTLKKAVPILDEAPGRFNSAFQMATKLSSDMTPLYDSLRSDGDFKAFDLRLAPAVLGELAKSLKSGDFSTLDLDGTTANYSLVGSKLTLSRTPVKMGKNKGVLHGTADVDKGTMDMALDLTVPTGALAGDLLKSAGLSSTLKTVDVVVKLTGPYNKPKLKILVGDATQEAVEALVEEVRDEVVGRANDALGQLVDEARKQGDRLVAEAEKAAGLVRSNATQAADAIRKEGDKSGDKIEKGAKNPIAKAAAKKAADAVRSEAKKKAKDVEKEGDKQADKLVSSAKKQRDTLIAEAEAEATIR